MRYKFRAYQYISDWAWLVFVPTVILFKNEAMFRNENFRLQFHFLGWHFSWMWIAESEEKK